MTNCVWDGCIYILQIWSVGGRVDERTHANSCQRWMYLNQSMYGGLLYVLLCMCACLRVVVYVCVSALFCVCVCVCVACVCQSVVVVVVVVCVCVCGCVCVGSYCFASDVMLLLLLLLMTFTRYGTLMREILEVIMMCNSNAIFIKVSVYDKYKKKSLNFEIVVI